MKRNNHPPRIGWKEKVESMGLLFHTVDDDLYWNESASYQFESREIDELEQATNELHQMCLAAVQKVIDDNLFDRFRILNAAIPVIRAAWEADPPSLYGRFDLAYDGQSPPKMLEYNADTPTSLLEAAVIQWHWLQDVHPQADQFNSIWEALVAKWKAMQAEGCLGENLIHFGSMDAIEDVMTTAVLMDTAQEAGLQVQQITMPELGYDWDNKVFVDTQKAPIQNLFKLYPWEWLLDDKFGRYALGNYPATNWIEPIWKMILSNKTILTVLWEMYPNHKYLLPAFLDTPGGLTDYVRKPILGREGANVTLVKGSDSVHTEGSYGNEGYVYQGLATLPQFEGKHMLIGTWVVDGEACGMGIRESAGPITDDLAQFIPHFFSA